MKRVRIIGALVVALLLFNASLFAADPFAGGIRQYLNLIPGTNITFYWLYPNVEFQEQENSPFLSFSDAQYGISINIQVANIKEMGLSQNDTPIILKSQKETLMKLSLQEQKESLDNITDKIEVYASFYNNNLLVMERQTTGDYLLNDFNWEGVTSIDVATVRVVGNYLIIANLSYLNEFFGEIGDNIKQSLMAFY